MIFNKPDLEFLAEISSGSVDLVLTDPPYDFKEDHKKQIHLELCRIIKENGTIIVFSPPENQWSFAGLTQTLFWAKPISTKNTSRKYSRFVEMIFIYQNKGYTWNNNRHWSQYVNIFEDKVSGTSGHPFEKPYSLIERLILNHSNENDVVVDPYSGSATVMRAAINNSRSVIVNDIDRKWVEYADVMVQGFCI